MAAGNWVDWNTGDLVTAAAFQDIQDSIVFIYADDSAANTALTNKVEGTAYYNTTDDVFKIWDGSAWQTIGTTPSWQDWTPTIANGSQGNGTITARYVQLGNLVIANFLFQLGSTSSITGDFNFSLPVTAANANVYGASLTFIENGVKDIMGLPAVNTTTFFCRAARADTNDVQSRTINATTPFTWGTSDKVIAGCYYEAS